MHRRIASVLIGAGLVAGALTASTPALAAPAAPATPTVQGAVSAKTLAPSCVKRSVSSNHRKVKVTNNCGIPVQINVQFKRSPDSGCYTLWADKSKTHSRPWPAKYQRTVSCSWL